MMAKLVKYEWNATSKTFGLLFLAVILLALMPVLGVTMVKSELFLNIAFFGVAISFFPLGIVYIVLTIQRYYRSMYADEGYLLHTLPVKPWEILLSKLLIYTFWGIMTTLVGGIVFTLMLSSSVSINSDISFFDSLKEFMDGLFVLFKSAGAKNLFWMGVIIFLMGVDLLSKIYLSITLGNLPCFSKWNDGLSVVFFFFLGLTESKIFSLLLSPKTPNWEMSTQSINLWSYTAVQTLFIVIFIAATIWLVRKKIQVR